MLFFNLYLCWGYRAHLYSLGVAVFTMFVPPTYPFTGLSY
jgi:hypothetical protein